MLVAINAADSEYTAGNGELQGIYEDLIAGAEKGAKAGTAAPEDKAGEPASEESQQAESTSETVTLNGQLVMPPYSIQYLKAL